MKPFKIVAGISIIGLFLLLGGCAPVVNPNYQPHLNQQGTAVHAQSVSITVQDLRPSDPKLLSMVRESDVGPDGISIPMTVPVIVIGLTQSCVYQ